MDVRFGRGNTKENTKEKVKAVAGKACAVLLSIMAMVAFTGAVQVDKAYAAGDKSIRVVFGTYDAEGVSSFGTERTFALEALADAGEHGHVAVCPHDACKALIGKVDVFDFVSHDGPPLLGAT